MAPGLARRHPEIKTYNGRGITDRAATIHADLSPLGFRASVRSANGSWYIDPYYVGPNPGVYASYWARHVSSPGARNPDTVIETPGHVPGIQKDLPTSTGDQLRTYRLALITDPGYSTYHGGPGFVTAAKVALMNRVSQVYEDDMTIRLQLVANNDLLNFNDWDKATAPNGPCGAAPCFTQSQVTGCTSTSRARYVIGQVIGASNYEIGHLALGQPGGGVANLGVVGGSNKAGGCTGIPTPIGDFFAVDYVAHEMGHQFAGNHTFNGNLLNCSGGNRSAATSVEPGSGQSVMAYAGICLDGRPAAAQRRLLLAAQPAGDRLVRLVEQAGDQRGADGLAPPLRRRQRSAGRHLRDRLRESQRDRSRECHHQRAAERDLARRRDGGRHDRHDRDRPYAWAQGR